MLTKERIIPAGIVFLLIGGLFAVVSNNGAPPPEGSFAAASLSLAPPVPEGTQPLAPPAPTPAISGRVQRNSNFFDIMTACGATPQEIDAIARGARPVYDFRRIYAGQHYEVYRDEDGAIGRICFSINEAQYVDVACGTDGIAAESREYPSRVAVREAAGVITSSLFASLAAQGLSELLGSRLVDIFAWDIDFFTDIRRGDFFRVIYEERTLLEGPASERGALVGAILAAEFNIGGHSRRAFRFENEPGNHCYFDDEGRSLRKQLLRAPLDYVRISSNFSRRRYHPVLRKYAPHLGIDYAAPHGTPVMTTGDGTVITSSRTRANGNYVKIRHANDYITYYLHLSRFGPGIKQGVRVRQGQVIGYVGATGYATGPHLDYRVKKGGVFVNPRSLQLPPTSPVGPERMADFTAGRDSLLVALRHIPVRDPESEHYADADPPVPHGAAGDRTQPAMLR